MELNKNLTAIILAAGKGRRLGHLTERLPKCLLAVAGQPVLFYQLQALRRVGIKQVVITTGFMESTVSNFTKTHFPNLEFTFVTNEKYATTNTLYSLALAAEAVAKHDTVLQLNGDVVFDEAIIEQLCSTPPEKSYLCLRRGICGEEEVKILLSPDGAVEKVNKLVSPHLALGEAIGINKFSTPFWAALKKALRKLREQYAQEYFEYAVEATIRARNKIFPFDIGDKNAIEIDFPEDLLRAEKEFSIKT